MWVIVLLFASLFQPAAAAVVDYRPDQCAFCNRETWCELRIKSGKRQCRGCKAVRYFKNYLYPPIDRTLTHWGETALYAIYGNVNPETGLRIYTRAFVSMGKRNGKSTWSAGLPIYHIDAEQQEASPKAFGAAAAKKQGGNVFDETAKMIRANPHLRVKYKINAAQREIFRRDGSPGRYEVLSADGDCNDGGGASLLIRDEIHRWKGARARTLVDVLTKGQLEREEPLDIQITTAGAEYESEIWWEEYQLAKKVAADPTYAPDYFVMIFEADAKRIQTDPEYWKSKEARVAGNPSHEDRGGHLKDSRLMAELDKAVKNPALKSSYLRYQLNVPILAHEDPVIDMPQWLLCGGGVDLRDNKVLFDQEKILDQLGLRNRPCFVGVDASWSMDLTAVVATFPPFPGVAEWTVMPFFWVPEERLPEIERICRMPFALWRESGLIIVTEGTGIDLRSVLELIRWLVGVVDVREVCYDKLNFRTEAMNLGDEGIVTTEVPQDFMRLSYATKFLLGLYPDKKIRHGNHPVLNWMASCLQLKYDDKDNCQPAKPRRLKSSKRIDGMQAIVTALSQAVVAEEETEVRVRGSVTS